MDISNRNSTRMSIFSILTCLLGSGLITGTASQLFPTTGPRNTVVVNGSETILECSIQGWDGDVLWWDNRTADSSTISINRVVLSNSWFYGKAIIEGSYNLVIKDTKLDMAGKYGCGTQDANIQRYAYLVVAEDDSPQCDLYLEKGGDTIVEGEQLSLLCTYKCTGAYKPVITWYNKNTSVDISTSDQSIDGSLCSRLAVATFTPDASFDTAVMECGVTFDTPEASIMPSDGNHDQRKPIYNATCSKQLNVLYSVRNAVVSLLSQNSTLYVGDVITCSANGNPAPTYLWIQLEGNGGNATGRTLSVTSDMVGSNTYACIATNVVQGGRYIVRADTSFYVEATNKPGSRSSAAAIAGGVIGGLLVAIILVLVAVFIVRKRRQARESSQERAGSVMDGMKSGQKFNNYMMHKPMAFFNKHVLGRAEGAQGTIRDAEASMGTVCPWELPRENLQMVKKLGEGSFGQVWKCEAWKLPQLAGYTNIAVKMLKENASDKDKQDLLGELNVMKNLPQHPNVVCLLGCCTLQDPIMIVVEFLCNGNLKDYLTDRRPQSRAEAEYMSKEEVTDGELGPRDLILFAYQSAKGMAHIASHKLLHRDLAARNILVGENRTCKVSDFGFARDVIDRNIYHRESQGPLPVRWMAPESIYDNVYTSQSDVWAFGVLLWEILTLGANPYPGLSGREVMDMIRRGERMERPEHCTEDVYDIALACWREEPEKRPNFDKLTAMLDSMLQEESDYLCLDDLQEDLYMNVDAIRSTEERI